MKKLLIMAAVAGFALTSCTNDEADLSMKNEQERVQISFAPPVQHKTTTRAAYSGTKFGAARATYYGEMLGDKYDKEENFDVYGIRYKNAYTTWGATSNEKVFGTVDATGEGDADYQEVSYVEDNNGWFPQYPYFFLDEYKYAFGAVSPRVSMVAKNTNSVSTAAIDYSATGLNIVDYIASEEMPGTEQTDKKTFKNHVDLMYSNRVRNIDRNSKVLSTNNGNTDGYNGVNLQFHHALASVHFKVCIDPAFVKQYNDAYGANGKVNKIADVDNTMFTLKSIKIYNVESKATFAQNITEADATATINTKGAPTWTPGNAEKTYAFFNGSTGINVPSSSATTIATAATDIVNTAADDADYGNSTQGGKIFAAETNGRYGLMIPQSLAVQSGSGFSADTDAYIEIIYDFTAVSGSSKATVTKTITKKIPLCELNQDWDMGYKYTYTIAFRGDLIYFAPDLEKWEDGVVDYESDNSDPKHPGDDDHIII